MRWFVSLIFSRNLSDTFSPRGKTPNSSTFVLGRCLFNSLTMCGDAVGDFLGAVAAHVVRADHEHDQFGLDAFELLAFRNAPKDVAGLIAADAEVGRFLRGKVLLPNVLAAWALPALRDRITKKEQVHITLLSAFQNALVAFYRPFILALEWLNGAVVVIDARGYETHRDNADAKEQDGNAAWPTHAIPLNAKTAGFPCIQAGGLCLFMRRPARRHGNPERHFLPLNWRTRHNKHTRKSR